MDQQQKQRLYESDDDCSSLDDDFVRVELPTAAAVDELELEEEQEKQQQNVNTSTAGSEETASSGSSTATDDISSSSTDDEEKKYYCQRCLNHRRLNLWEGHEPININCPVYDCVCQKCQWCVLNGVVKAPKPVKGPKNWLNPPNAEECALWAEQRRWRRVQEKKREIIHICNPKGGNGWNPTNTMVTICADFRNAINMDGNFQNVFAMEGFHIPSREHYEKMEPDSVIVYYYECTVVSGDWRFRIGLSDGVECDSDSLWDGDSPNSYFILSGCDYCHLNGMTHYFKLPEGAIAPEWSGHGDDVVGCGLWLKPLRGGLAIFFTLNGTLLSEQFPIRPSADHLFPTIAIRDQKVEANFGKNSNKPFAYDIKKCPGMR